MEHKPSIQAEYFSIGKVSVTLKEVIESREELLKGIKLMRSALDTMIKTIENSDESISNHNINE